MTIFKALHSKVAISLAAFVALLVVLALGASPASAEGPSVWWSAGSGARPTVLVPGQVGEVVVWAQNLGDGPTGAVVSLEDRLPVGLHALGISAVSGGSGSDQRGPVRCSLARLSCSYGDFVEGPKGEALETPLHEVVEFLPPYELLEVKIKVEVSAGAESAANTVIVSGGGATRVAHAANTIRVGETPAGFGFESYSLNTENEGGALDTQAGSHPFQLTSVFTLNNKGLNAENHPVAVGQPKNIADKLPAGLIGNPTPFAQCTDQQFATVPQVKSEFLVNECPAASAVGVATLQWTDPEGAFTTATAPIFNVVPRPGEPARFGFKAAGIVSAFLETSVRTGDDYGVTVTSENITELVSLLDVRLTFWGVPGDPRHDLSRGWECMYHFGSCPVTQTTTPPPFLVMPSSCQKPLLSSLQAVSWTAEGRPPAEPEATLYQPVEAIDGCNRLPFEPEIRVTPDGTAGSSPSGLNVDVHVPQASVLNAESLSESAVRDINVALPEGVAVNPSGGDGLQACTGDPGALGAGTLGSPGDEAGFTGLSESITPGSQTATFSAFLQGTQNAAAAGFEEPLQQGINFCPDAAKIGTVRIATPLLPAGQDVTGDVYLASQNQNPFGSLVALYIIAMDPISGTVVKLTGETHLTETGQLLTTFKNSPQLAFEDAELHFFGGERAPLATPARCGAYTTNASFAPWSGNEPVGSSSTFDITSGPKTQAAPAGTPCPGPALPFSPSLTGGSTNINAGSFSPLTTTIGREDGQQNMAQVTLHFPPGLSGLLSGVKLCPEAQANEGTCGPESQIGETTVSAGVGSDPVTVKGGRVYITEHYGGAPFGLSIVNPVKAGPFDLERDTSNPNQNPACDCIVVRARIEVDPTTAALTVTTNHESEGHAIPHLIDGIPVQIQKVNVLVNREHFTFNPTNCEKTEITGSISSDEGASFPVSVPFQPTNCAVLKFEPKFSVSTSAKTSKANGASLTATVSEPAGAQGTQANIAKVKVELPRQLPSRLTTLQKACTARQFEVNPANCPSESKIGYAVVHTPLLPVPLEGPAIFVSHGGESFPSLTMVLQGDGVRVDLVGATFISKAGITSTTFKTVPDAPFETFSLTLPEGPFSALAANGNLCTQTLTMPTEFTAQNGAVINKSTPVLPTGCKAAIRVVKHTVKGKTATVVVAVPAAGKLVASGNGLGRATGNARGAGNVTVKLTLSQKSRALPSKHHGHKLKVKVKLQFIPKQGAKLSTSVTVSIG